MEKCLKELNLTDFAVIGACEEGVIQFFKEYNITKASMPVSELLEIAKNWEEIYYIKRAANLDANDSQCRYGCVPFCQHIHCYGQDYGYGYGDETGGGYGDGYRPGPLPGLPLSDPRFEFCFCYGVGVDNAGFYGYSVSTGNGYGYGAFKAYG